MITSSNGNQYLRPDYLTPLPTTLDAKKSPLALLAQTCSQIGADTSSQKTEKSSKKEPQREKASPASSSVSSSGSPVASKSGFKPYESSIVSEEKPRAKTPAKKAEQGSPRASPSRKTPQQESVRSSSPGKPPLSPYLYPELLRSPYLAYPSRLKGGECRDPYCAGCHLLGKSCPQGCTQCEKAGLHYAQLAALAASAQPYLCSWIGSDASYCGKRFATSEELLSHLRSHTGDFHPLLHRSYPTPPLSPLAAPRYHPYSKPPLLPPSPFALPPHPGLSPYLSPYSLYGPRLGASHP